MSCDVCRGNPVSPDGRHSDRYQEGNGLHEGGLPSELQRQAKQEAKSPGLGEKQAKASVTPSSSAASKQEQAAIDPAFPRDEVSLSPSDSRRPNFPSGLSRSLSGTPPTHGAILGRVPLGERSQI